METAIRSHIHCVVPTRLEVLCRTTCNVQFYTNVHTALFIQILLTQVSSFRVEINAAGSTVDSTPQGHFPTRVLHYWLCWIGSTRNALTGVLCICKHSTK